MGITAGSEVAVLSLGRKRGEVVELLRDGVYRVRVGTLIITCRADDLEAVSPRRKKRASQRDATEAPLAPTGEGPPIADPGLTSVDLHGLSVEEARARVVSHISRAILAGLERVEIVHGIGTGALRRAIVADLKKIPAVKHVRPHPTNPGVTIVSF